MRHKGEGVECWCGMTSIQDLLPKTWGVMPMHTAFIPSRICYRYWTDKEPSQSSSFDLLSMTSTVLLHWLWSKTRAAKYIQFKDLMLLSSTLSPNPENPLIISRGAWSFLKTQMKFTCTGLLYPNQHDFFPSYRSHMNLGSPISVTALCISSGVYINSFLALWQNPQPANKKQTCVTPQYWDHLRA